MLIFEDTNRKTRRSFLIKALALFVVIVLLSNMIAFTALADVPSFVGVNYADRLSSNLRASDVKWHWARVPMIRMGALSVLKGRDKKPAPNAWVSREEAITAIVRLMGRDEDAQKINAASGRKSGIGGKRANFSQWAYGYLEVAQQEGVITKNERQGMMWQGAALRQEVAAWTARALKLTPLYGRNQEISRFSDSNKISSDYCPYLSAAIQHKIISGDGNKIRPNDPMTRAELASVLDRVKYDFPSGYEVHQGKLLSSYPLKFVDEGTSSSCTVFEIEDLNGERFNLKAEDTILNGWERTHRDFIVLKNGEVLLSYALSPGDFIEYAVKDGEVVFAEVINVSGMQIRGELMSLDEQTNTVVIKGESGRVYEYSANQNVEVSIDGRPSNIFDLVEGQEVTAKVVGGMLRGLVASSGSEPGYIAKESLNIEGRVKSVEKDDDYYNITVSLPNGREESFAVGPHTRIIKANTTQDVRDLRIGDRIIAYFSVLDKGVADRIAVAKTSTAKNILKARISGGFSNSELIIEDINRFYYGSWIKEMASGKLAVSDGATAYYCGELIDIKQLYQNHKGDYIYILNKSDFGENQAEKIVVKSGDEYSVNGEIEEIRWSEGFIETGRVEGYFGQDTLTVVGRQICDAADIDDEEDVFLITNDEGDTNRVVAMIQTEFYDSDLQFYRGYIDEITNKELSIDEYNRLEGNKWSKTRDSHKYFDFKDDVYIIDAIGKAPKHVSLDDFKKDRFEQEYYNKYTYLVTKNDKVEGILILKDEVETPSISIGELALLKDNDLQIVLNNAKDYSGFRREWNNDLTSLELDMSKALLIKGDQFIKQNDLKLKDKLYIIRNNNEVLIGIVIEE
ncbi:MAG TPA: S-layer homology domain-containing protein [Thermoanaerobacterales bacterium]|nr:S-layer homology domain-containing protein [Thermoanaerobacterales bacterium]